MQSFLLLKRICPALGVVVREHVSQKYRNILLGLEHSYCNYIIVQARHPEIKHFGPMPKHATSRGKDLLQCFPIAGISIHQANMGLNDTTHNKLWPFWYKFVPCKHVWLTRCHYGPFAKNHNRNQRFGGLVFPKKNMGLNDMTLNKLSLFRHKCVPCEPIWVARCHFSPYVGNHSWNQELSGLVFQYMS